MNARAQPLHVLDAAPATREPRKLGDPAAMDCRKRAAEPRCARPQAAAAWLDAAGLNRNLGQPRPRIWIARQGQQYMERHAVEELTQEVLLELARQVATSTEQEVGKEKPRCLCRTSERVSYSLRPARPRRARRSAFDPQAAVLDLSLEDYEGSGAFDRTNRIGAHEEEASARCEPLTPSVSSAIFCGSPSGRERTFSFRPEPTRGKPRCLNALLKEISPDERLS